eukprot:gene7060-9514_t
MASIPDMTSDRERLNQIDGAMPRLNAVPAGCAFNPRCPRVFDRCLTERPELLPAGETRAACWLHAPEPQRAKDLAKVFDVSAPWLNRVVERRPR